MSIINTDPELKRLFTLVTSVVGIGRVTAVQLLVTTNEFHCCPVKVFLKKVRSSRKATPFVLILELPHFNTQHE